MEIKWQKVNEASNGDWSIMVDELRVEREQGEGTNVKVYTIRVGNTSVAVSVTVDGKLRRVIINESKVLKEDKRSIKKGVRTLVFDYGSQKVTVTEGEIEVEKKPNGMKSLKVIKSEARTFSLSKPS